MTQHCPWPVTSHESQIIGLPSEQALPACEAATLAGSYRALGFGRWGKKGRDWSSSLGALTDSLPASQQEAHRLLSHRAKAQSQGCEPKRKAWTCSDAGLPGSRPRGNLLAPEPRGVSKPVSSNRNSRRVQCQGACHVQWVLNPGRHTPAFQDVPQPRAWSCLAHSAWGPMSKAPH